MTDDSTNRTRTATLVVVLTVMIGVGLTFGFAGGGAVLAQQDDANETNQTDDGMDQVGNETNQSQVGNETNQSQVGNETNQSQDDNETNQSQDGKTVTAEGVSVERLHMENVRVSGLTVDVSQLVSEGAEAAVADAAREAMGDNVEGLEVESLEFGNVSTADISVENNVATIDAEVEYVTVTGVSADRVMMRSGGSPGASGDTPAADRSQSEVVGNMMAEANVDADRVVAEGVSIDRIVLERGGESGPETPSGNETDNETETPADNETETPADNETDNDSEVPDFEPPSDNETDNATVTPTDNETDDDAEQTASVQFDDQTSNGTAVMISQVNTSDGGFVAIHDASLLEGDVFGSVIGVTDYLEPGEHEDVSAELYNVSGAEFDETELSEDQTLIAMAHLDSNDDQTYDFVASDGEADGPYVADGEAVTDAGNVTVDGNGSMDGNETNTSTSLGVAR